MLALQRKLHSAPCVDDGRVKDRNGRILRLYNKAVLSQLIPPIKPMVFIAVLLCFRSLRPVFLFYYKQSR